ncbi:uncharacterized protein BJ171DRAFT_208549 [Polychytrium aggregatum]|uniref:uncharacterized protein n=1 Tax=Polychytrium aggregatum TaxID=110093 RepID=UPI0022FDD3D5|nr:uncharacterized protein BJ171DRAFT_208549 [Polychytrium aggregatum]KAI9208479.1 hypothetical protein BJ171DRAFT_208549 [Polychytrium aggregatum]
MRPPLSRLCRYLARSDAQPCGSALILPILVRSAMVWACSAHILSRTPIEINTPNRFHATMKPCSSWATAAFLSISASRTEIQHTDVRSDKFNFLKMAKRAIHR